MPRPLSLLGPLLLAFAASALAQPVPRKVTEVPATATLVPLSANWRIDGDLDRHALLISLQGLANRDQPRLYLEYPKNWQWEIVRPLEGFLQQRHGIHFDRLATDDVDDALSRFRPQLKGYVVWDRNVRSSLIVAFTAAGVLDAVVVDDRLEALAQKHGLRKLEDLRGRFRGKSDAEIYQWAYDHYWSRCSRDYYVLLGGPAGEEMQPGIADFGVRQHAFFTDLSANSANPRQLALERRILSQQHPASIVLGWHSYGKDTEGAHTTLVSSYGLKMEGLHNLPNVSFTCQIPFTPGFHFTNTRHVRPGEHLQAQAKVYVAAISTDSMGIGSWTKPGRGRIPYAWQVMMNWAWMNPPALQYFYESRTPNDYFIGGLSGPGYMYPKAIPAAKFPALMADARSLMQQLDLHVLEIMDYSEGNRQIGNTDLTEAVVDRYYHEFPDVIGFVNGYGSARTFALRDTRPLISYDYYLDVHRPVDDAVADLDELMTLNPRRPYFLLMHVREANTVGRVATILDHLDEPVDVVPLDVFLKLAASDQTYRTQYERPDAPIDHNP
ncbi:MAG TPA: GxGYxYP domain-containing protein [Opitutaceae bacterium]|nr:GxGYxYP domain-containing protein [Opitutaceae bacterium]